MSAQADFEITTNAPWAFPWQFQDENETAIDYTGSTFKLQTKLAAGGGVVTTLTSPAGGITHDDLASGKITVTFPAGIAVGDYVHDLARLVGGVIVELMWRGTLKVEQGVTT